MAAKTDSFITFPRLPVSSSLPVPSTTFASTSSVVPPTLVQARPVTRPTWSLCGISSGQEAARPQELLQVRGRNDQLLGRVIFYKAHRALAADGSKLALECPHTGFSCIAGDDLANGVVCEPDAGFCDAMLRKLLRKQVLLRDLQLFFVRVGAQLNDLHAVE